MGTSTTATRTTLSSYMSRAIRACQDCHDPHTLELKIEECAACHEDVASVDDLNDVRMPGSLVDYDGDGDIAEGVYYELVGMQEALYTAIQAYRPIMGAPSSTTRRVPLFVRRCW